MEHKRLVVLLVCMVGLSCFICSGFGFLVIPRDIPVTATEEAWLVKPEDVSRHWVDVKGPLPPGKLTYEESLLGEKSLEYEWQMEYGFISVIAEKTISNSGDFMLYLLGIRAGVESEGGTLTEEKDILRWGDQSKLFSLVNDGVWLGYIFLGEQGSKIIMVTVTGPFDPNTVDRQVLFSDLEVRLERFGETF